MLLMSIVYAVQELKALSAEFDGHAIWIKRDDKTSSIYGGNKPRKFEFLIASILCLL